ncbi:RHS repeat-associated core domain-containing protein [Lampropedia aestuarii]|uniref:RHS repeat-associated core domain-containing protein n=1 Tax=Lampropedia aestuarii TaxID=2562762 RepID=UPI001F11372A|nr:RHS repeat-associated core domain-containing protein [Lampropedia aestuarii]
MQATDSSLQSHSEYDAWGQREQQGNTASRHGYTGHLQDTESGLIYARARYYNPMLGRFISQDPLEGTLNSPITWNAYVYGNANPLMYWDPTGEAGWLTWWEETTASSVESWGQSQQQAEANQQQYRSAGYGFMKGLASLGHASAWGWNATSDLIVRNNGLAGYEEAAVAMQRKEQTLADAFEATGQAARYVKENPAQAAKQAAQGIADFGSGLVTGDARSWGTAGEMLSGCALMPAGCARSVAAAGAGARTLVREAGEAVFSGPVAGSRTAQLGAVNIGEGKGLAANTRPEVSSSASLLPEPAGALNASSAVRPGQTGSYGDLKAQKRVFGETEPLDMDHQPSFAAQVAAREAAFGRTLTKAERVALKASTPAIASPRRVHQQTSPTYGGRNTQSRIAEDAADLNDAMTRDRAVFYEAMRNR